jgi:hypothetical protein
MLVSETAPVTSGFWAIDRSMPSCDEPALAVDSHPMIDGKSGAGNETKLKRIILK